MSKKPKFKPVITRVKLNPEQAVLACNCYSAGQRISAGNLAHWAYATTCSGRSSTAHQHVNHSCCFGSNNGFPMAQGSVSTS